MDRDGELADFERFHFQEHRDADGARCSPQFVKPSGQPPLPVKALPWFIFWLASPFNETLLAPEPE